MKKERFFRLLGDLDDHILDKYREMDVQLSHKALRKKRALRVLIIAACLALLIGACVPVGMMIAKWMEDRPVGPWPGPDPWGESGVEHGTDEPPQQDVSVTVRSLEELEKMREMLECTDEQMLDAYLQEVLGGRSKSKQELENFVALVDGTAYAWLIDGELTYLDYQRGPSAGTGKLYEVLYVTVTAPNGEWIRCDYQLSWTDVEKTIDKLVQNNADENLLSAPISTADGRLTLYVETRGPHPTYDGDFIQWWCVLDGQIVQINYFVADADRIDTAALVGSLEVADSITDYLENVNVPVTTQPPRETESQWNPDDIPDFVKLGYLNVLIYDENDDLVYHMNVEELEAIKDELSVGYVSGGTVVVECYAAYDRSGKVARYRCEGSGTIEWISASDIKSDVTVDVQADYYHYLRLVIPMDALTIGEETAIYLIGDHLASGIEGWALFQRLDVYADETLPDQDHAQTTEPIETPDSDANADIPAQFVRAGFLSIDFQDESGTVHSVISEDEMGNFYGTVELEELPQGYFIIDGYACFNQSDNVTLSVIPDGVTLELLDESSIKGRLPWKPWETDADYVLGFRIVIPTEALEIGHRGAIVFLEPEDSYPVIQVWFDIKNS